MRQALTGALLALALLACREEPARPGAPTEPKPTLSLLTSLPLVFGESLALDAPKHPLMARLEQDFEVQLVDGPEELPGSGLLLAIQPQALTAERLVQLDRWVREGGRLLLLADPRFVWQSERPLGDKARPAFSFADTGLLRHWGLRLLVGDQDGLTPRRLGDKEILTGSPGELQTQPGGPCKVSPDALVARCSLGRGSAVVVADSDLVQVGVTGGLDGPTDSNHASMVAELQSLR